MADLKLNTGLGVVCCTRNRHSQVGRLLLQLNDSNPAPDKVLVVDSSDSVTPIPSNLVFHLDLILSKPGLPHQRNIGLDWAKKNGLKSVLFLDDDIAIETDILQHLQRSLQAFPGALIGAVDIGPKGRGSKLVASARKLTGRSNFLTRSVDAILGPTPDGPVQCDWVPGFFMAGPVYKMAKVRFSESIRMIGEDVEFQLRWGLDNQIIVDPRLRVLHLAESTGRLKVAESIEKWDWFRFETAKQYSDRFSQRAVVASAILYCLGFLLVGRIAAALGHLVFLRSLVLRRPPNLDLR